MTAALLIGSILATVIAHEAGHGLAATALGLPWRPTLTRHGPGIRIGSDAIQLRPFQIRVTAAAGPAANLALAAVAFRAGLPLLVLTNLEFAVVNVLPLRRSDGRRMIGGHA